MWKTEPTWRSSGTRVAWGLGFPKESSTQSNAGTENSSVQPAICVAHQGSERYKVPSQRLTENTGAYCIIYYLYTVYIICVT